MNRPAAFLGRLTAGVTAVALAGVAHAQLAKAMPLSKEATKSAIFGIDMEGIAPDVGMRWRECIDPKGETLYETPEGIKKGRVFVSAEGLACFSYEDSGYKDIGCFQTYKTNKGLRFEGGGLFVTTSVRTGVKSCKPRNDLIG